MNITIDEMNITPEARETAVNEAAITKGLFGDKQQGHFVQQLLNSKLAELKKENTYLRAFHAKQACAYGHNKDGVCQLGYPGCVCADDMLVFDEEHVRLLRQQLADAKMAASNNADWFDNLVSDLAVKLGCAKNVSEIFAAIDKLK